MLHIAGEGEFRVSSKQETNKKEMMGQQKNPDSDNRMVSSPEMEWKVLLICFRIKTGCQNSETELDTSKLHAHHFVYS